MTFSAWDLYYILGLLKKFFYKLWLITTILILALVPSKILLNIKNSLELLITVENSLDILRTPWWFSYLQLIMWSLILYLLDRNLYVFIFLVLITNYGFPLGLFLFFPILSIDGIPNIVLIVACELRWTHSCFPFYLCMMTSFKLIYDYYDFFNQIYD